MKKKLLEDSLVHRFIHENPRCTIGDIGAGLDVNRTTIRTRCEVLIDDGKIKRTMYSDGTQHFYTSIKRPPVDVQFTPSRKCTPAKVLLSSRWLPNELNLGGMA